MLQIIKHTFIIDIGNSTHRWRFGVQSMKMLGGLYFDRFPLEQSEDVEDFGDDDVVDVGPQ